MLCPTATISKKIIRKHMLNCFVLKTWPFNLLVWNHFFKRCQKNPQIFKIRCYSELLQPKGRCKYTLVNNSLHYAYQIMYYYFTILSELTIKQKMYDKHNTTGRIIGTRFIYMEVQYLLLLNTTSTKQVSNYL